jgi:phosphonopyruvate decarboxylase
MGQITHDLLALMGLEHRPFPNAPDQIAPGLAEAVAAMDASSLPFAFVMAKGDVAETALNQPPRAGPAPGKLALFTTGGARPTRAQALERFLAQADDSTAVIATTGKCGRELFTLADREQHLYQVGSMGGASGMGLGVALNTSKRVVVLDGDGAALMKLGTLATVGAYAQNNLTHVLLDNGVHDSTGGQATVSGSVDFARIALACGYAYAAQCDSLDGFERALGQAGEANGPALVHLRIAPGSMDKLGRPTVTPFEVARRFKGFLAS